ncbi:basement membrane-specific heparan sulfate proteoglycan core protein-like [Anguilla anguilla]|uniref:basement membrane-specific heparan sulfate proteoglycan core protein-like n=1 Tax=Anguilla anguilla TaxID=7936 RepID=UPI0015AC2CE4|nr:basement membrane-specific heparan sulfate proteoglycan core protein-like [Anguilla anguilla]
MMMAMMMMTMMMTKMMITSASPFERLDIDTVSVTTGVPDMWRIVSSLPPFVQFESGAPVMLEGDLVKMSCPSLPFEAYYVWSYLNRSSGVVREIGYDKKLPPRIATVGDSGQYSCTANFFRAVAQFHTELTVLERLLPPSVVVSSQGSVVLEGSGLVTLKCVPTSGPSLITWSWNKLGGAEPQKVGAEQTLTLRRIGDSGLYECQAHTSTLNLTQVNSSLPHQVNIIPSPVGLPVGMAALALGLLCLFLLLLLGVWVFLHRGTKPTALNKLSHDPPPRVSHCSGLPGPGMELKDSSRSTEGEVYMNCKTAGEAYTDLNHYDMSEENTYDCLS